MRFTDVLLHHGIRFRQMRGDPNEVQMHCIFCREKRGEQDTTYCLHVNTASGAGHCWHSACGWKSRHAVFQIVRKLAGYAQAEAFAPEEEASEEAHPVKLPADFQRLTAVYDDLDRNVLAYLHKRGILNKQIYQYSIGVSYLGRYAYRILFPIWHERKLKFFTARDFTGTQTPKYLTPSGEKWLYGFDPKAETCILSEGVFKSLRIAQVTHFNSAATLGHSLTDRQLEQIREGKCSRVIVWPDPDTAGRKGAVSICDRLAEEWGGSIQVVADVDAPADEVPVPDLAVHLQQNPREWNFSTRQRLLQKSD